MNLLQSLLVCPRNETVAHGHQATECPGIIAPGSKSCPQGGECTDPFLCS